MRAILLVALFAVGICPACDGTDDDENPTDGGPDGSADTDTDTDADAGPDAGPNPSLACETLGLPVAAFADVVETTALRGDAADFTVPTTAGDWNLEANWSGCDVYLFILESAAQIEDGYGYAYWERQADIDALFESSPLNVHYFFVPGGADQATIDTALTALEGRVDAAVGALPAEDQPWWTDRVHYVTSAPADLPGWLGEILSSPGFGIGIDRAQKIRYVGSLGDPARYNSTVGWFGPNMRMAVNEAVLYNFEAERETRLAAEGATVVELWNQNPVASADSQDVDIVLPDAAAMAGFDTLEFDMMMTCVGAGEVGYCPAWDYDVFLYLCDEEDPTICDTQVGHWITSYHREGRWVHDVSGVLPLLANGGTRRFRLEITDPWEITLSLRFSNGDKAARPSEATPLFAGQFEFDESYNSNFAPITLPVPADATKVELATVITGHGMSPPANCCEFTNTDHHFIVNGTDNVQYLLTSDTTHGCMDQVADGTVPNQYGTWWYGRAGWCPGKHVDMVMTDVTSQVVLGADNTFEYEGFYNGEPYVVDTDTGTWRHFKLSSWLVVSR